MLKLPKIGFRWGSSHRRKATVVPAVAPAPQAVTPTPVQTPPPAPPAPVAPVVEAVRNPVVENPPAITPEPPKNPVEESSSPDEWQRWTARFLKSELAELRTLAASVEASHGVNPTDNTILRALVRAQKLGGDWREHASTLHGLDKRRK